MFRMTTTQTMMMPNGQLFLDRFAANASLTGAVWIDLFQLSTSVFSFVFEFLKKRTPSGIVNLFCKDAFRHSENVKVFNRYQIVFFNQMRRNFVSKITSLILNLLVNFAKLINCLSSLIRAFLSAGNFSLDNPQSFLRSFKILEIVNLRCVRKSCKRFDSNVNADLFSRFRQDLFFIFDGENYKPTRNFTLNRAGFNLSNHRLRQVNLDRSDFGKFKFVACQSESALRKTERIKEVFAFETRKASFHAFFNSTEKGLESFVQSFENVLQNLAVNCFKVISNGFNLSELVGLLEIRNADSIQFPSISAFLQTCIVKFAAKVKRLVKTSNDRFGGLANFEFERFHVFDDNSVMSKKQVLNALFHSVFLLNYHLVVCTKYRRKCITPEMLERLKEIFTELIKKWEGELIEFNGEADHVHLLISINPKVRLSDFVNNLKTVSSRLIRRDFKDELSKVYWKPVFWSRSYCVLTCGGAPLTIIKQYIENQRAISEAD